MDKKRLQAAVRSRSGWDRAMTSRAVEAVLASIREIVKRGSRLTLHGFGTFSMKLAKPRRARNLKTGQAVLVPARKKVRFRASPDFLD